MTTKLFVFSTLVLSAIPVFSADSTSKFAPGFFAFENGVRFGSVEKQISVLKELGYDSLGSAKPQNLAERLKLHKEAGVPISSLYIGGPIGGKVNPLIAESIRQLKGYDTIIELYVQRGGKNTDEEAVAFVQEVADLAKASKLKVVLYPHAGFYVDTIGDGVRIAKLAKRGNVGVMFNLCHFLKVEPQSDLKKTLESAGDLLWRASTCGAEIGGNNWGQLIQPLDKGTFDQVALLKMLRELGFTGDVGLQCYGVKGDAKANLSNSITAWEKYLAESQKD
jgi:sugar phosphate isomerase/epimerase